MTTPAWDDLDAFLDADDFGVVATITLKSGATRNVTGIYDGPYTMGILGRETEQDTDKPKFTCKASALSGVQRGDGITIQGEGAFGILTLPQPDGTGMAVLELARE